MQKIDAAIEQALQESRDQHILGKDVTPFLLARVCELTEKDSLASNIALVKNNACLGAEVAVQLAARLHAHKE